MITAPSVVEYENDYSAKWRSELNQSVCKYRD